MILLQYTEIHTQIPVLINHLCLREQKNSTIRQLNLCDMMCAEREKREGERKREQEEN